MWRRLGVALVLINGSQSSEDDPEETSAPSAGLQRNKERRIHTPLFSFG